MPYTQINAAASTAIVQNNQRLRIHDFAAGRWSAIIAVASPTTKYIGVL
jgi:hypothetical protein